MIIVSRVEDNMVCCYEKDMGITLPRFMVSPDVKGGDVLMDSLEGPGFFVVNDIATALRKRGEWRHSCRNPHRANKR